MRKENRFIQDLENKKILVLGFGIEGLDNLMFLRRFFPKKKIGIADRLEIQGLRSKFRKVLQKDQNLVLHLGRNYLKNLSNYDLIIKSPGIPPFLPEIRERRKKGARFISQTEIFFKLFPGRIVGVTGTKGKSTTAFLIYKILKEGGFRVCLAGNIGKPVLSFLEKATKRDIFVYELSCHQLYGLRKSPQVAILLNIFPEHLDYYPDFETYIQAKSNIARWQKESDFLIYNPQDEIVKKIASESKAKKIRIEPQKCQRFFRKLGISKIPMVNLAAAFEVGRIFGISRRIIEKTISDFQGLPHRLEYVGEYRKIKFYNDSLATIPEATIEAINRLGKVETLFLGGFDRGLNYQKLAEVLLDRKIKNLIFFPESGPRIWEQVKKIARKRKIRKMPQAFFVSSMKEGVKLAYEQTSEGKICLLSCAAPSFGLFKDYRDRGNQFKKWVKKLGK